MTLRFIASDLNAIAGMVLVFTLLASVCLVLIALTLKVKEPS